MSGAILVVEDSPTQAEHIRLLLEEAGYPVEVAANGRLGLERVHAAPPCIILSDILMPEMDGYALCRRVKSAEATRGIPFVMLTSLQVGDEKVRALDAGADDLLSKPVDEPELLARVRSLLRVRSLHDQLEQRNDELRQLAAELEERVAQRTAELRAKGEEVRAMTQQLWQVAKLATVGELAASIAHELNNPLATVSLRIESLLDRTPQGDPSRRSLEIVEQEAQRMSRLVANLLQSSRRSQAQISSVDVGKELAGALELVEHQLRQRGVQISQELTADLALIHADRQLLRQVFLNLLTNASDAMPGGGRLTVRADTGTLEAGAPAIIVEIRDTGSGITAEDLPQVMEPFFTTKPEGQGTGLGLAICKRIVEQHGGTIHIESQPGLDTTVRLALPLGGGRGLPGSSQGL